MKTFNGVFYDFSSKVDEALHLEDSLQKAKQEAELLKEEILNEPKLHQILTTVGIIHDNKLYKKKIKSGAMRTESGIAVPDYYLSVEDYIEPVNSFQLDTKLGDNNE